MDVVNRTIPAAPTRRQRLLARIHRRYVTTTQPVRLGPLSFDFTRIADPDRVLDQVADEADLRERLSGKRQPDEHLHLPYWAELWESAIGIGQFLVREGWEPAGSRQGSGFRVQGSGARMNPVRSGWTKGPPAAPTDERVDLGSDRYAEDQASVPMFAPASASNLNPELRTLNPPSVLDLGCGMGLSGTIAAALGAKVLFADIEPPALLFARLNSLPWASRVGARKLNWRTDRLDERFDLIIGADILYERAQWEYQEPFLRHHLAPGGQILLGEPGRQTGDIFIDWIKPRGWVLEIFFEKVPTREKPVRIFRLSSMRQ